LISSERGDIQQIRLAWTTYNGAGSLTSDGSKSFGYDAFGLLRSVALSGSLVGSYSSNAFNQRVYKSASDATKRFVYGPSGELLFEGGLILIALPGHCAVVAEPDVGGRRASSSGTSAS
jgi:hypothetical protein